MLLNGRDCDPAPDLIEMTNYHLANARRERGDPVAYDRYRPVPPPEVVTRLCQMAREDHPRVADLGCGTGNSTRIWIGTASCIAGIDPNEDFLVYARSKAPEIDFRCGFGHDTGLPSTSVDIVTCVQSLHWMEPEPTFREIGRILCPGGIFAAIFSRVFPEGDLKIRSCLQAASEYVRAKGLDVDQRNWSGSDFEPFLKEGEEFVLEGRDDFDIAGRVRTSGNVATALSDGATPADIKLDVLSGKMRGRIAFHLRAVRMP